MTKFRGSFFVVGSSHFEIAPPTPNSENRTPNSEKNQLSIKALISSSVARLKSPLKVYFSVDAARA